ncbi:MAG: hypothetical protein QFE16_03500 [Pseudomonadota bacterium]|nr:hypothetical protein [Pseudomonadota bacterium]
MAPPSNVDALIAKAQDWFERLSSGRGEAVQSIANKEQITGSYLTRVIYLAFLAPDIVQRIAGKPIPWCRGRPDRPAAPVDVQVGPGFLPDASEHACRRRFERFATAGDRSRPSAGAAPTPMAKTRCPLARAAATSASRLA